MKERTVLGPTGPTGLDQFFLSQNVQLSAYILYIHFWLGTQKSISALTIFSININFDEVISEIDNVLQKRIV